MGGGASKRAKPPTKPAGETADPFWTTLADTGKHMADGGKLSESCQDTVIGGDSFTGSHFTSLPVRAQCPAGTHTARVPAFLILPLLARAQATPRRSVGSRRPSVLSVDERERMAARRSSSDSPDTKRRLSNASRRTSSDSLASLGTEASIGATLMGGRAKHLVLEDASLMHKPRVTS